VRFVILQHDHPSLHWDLMLEAGPALRTWRLAAPPATGQAVPAEPSFDHRLVYLDYEGPVSGGRGSVVRWDAGTFAWLQDGPDQVAVRLAGGKVQGQGVLERGPSGEWSFSVTQDQPGT
jgi:DNA polymerase Ligase (LigD)